MHGYQQNWKNRIWDPSTNQEVDENWDDQNDDGETKTILGLIGPNLKVLTLRTFMMITMLMVQ